MNVENWTDEWGVNWHSDGDTEGFTDPRWDYIFDDTNDEINCPNCGREDLRYHCNEGRCIWCHSTFNHSQITDYAGPGWRHGR